MKFNSLFNITILPFTVAALSLIGFSNQAKAFILSGSASGIWGEPTPGTINTEPVYTGVGTNAFTWGDPTLFENAFSNKLVFGGSYFSTHTGSLFKIGDLTYHNGTVLYGTSVESVPLKLSLSFDQPTEVDNNFVYEFSLQNTPNLSEDPKLNADSVFVANNNDKFSFIYGGDEYTLSFSGFSQDNGQTTFNELQVLEGDKTTAAIFAKIDKVPEYTSVPEPGFPVALSLVGIYFISRRKAKKTK